MNSVFQLIKNTEHDAQQIDISAIQQTPISKLPAEVLQLILMHLPNTNLSEACFVNQFWHVQVEQIFNDRDKLRELVNLINNKLLLSQFDDVKKILEKNGAFINKMPGYRDQVTLRHPFELAIFRALEKNKIQEAIKIADIMINETEKTYLSHIICQRVFFKCIHAGMHPTVNMKAVKTLIDKVLKASTIPDYQKTTMLEKLFLLAIYGKDPKNSNLNEVAIKDSYSARKLYKRMLNPSEEIKNLNQQLENLNALS